MSKRNLSQHADELVAFIDQNPSGPRGNNRDAAYDVSNEPRLPKGDPDGGQWTTAGADSATSVEDSGGKCPNGYKIVPMLVTAYTNGPESTGKSPGHPQYGITKSGAVAGPGTIAADSKHSFGTRMYVPGYGWGTVQDIGGKVKANHIDLWFEKVEDAKKWGKRTVNVVICNK